MIKDEKELKSIIKEAEISNSFFNFKNKHNSNLIKNKIQDLKSSNMLNLDFPLNVLFEFIVNSNEIYTLEENSEMLKNDCNNVIKMQ